MTNKIIKIKELRRRIKELSSSCQKIFTIKFMTTSLTCHIFVRLLSMSKYVNRDYNWCKKFFQNKINFCDSLIIRKIRYLPFHQNRWANKKPAPLKT